MRDNIVLFFSNCLPVDIKFLAETYMKHGYPGIQCNCFGMFLYKVAHGWIIPGGIPTRKEKDFIRRNTHDLQKYNKNVFYALLFYYEKKIAVSFHKSGNIFTFAPTINGGRSSAG